MQLAEIRNQIATLDDGHRKVRAALINVYAIALFLRSDSDAWFEFCGREEWRTFSRPPSLKKPDDSLHFTIRFAVGFGSPSKTKRVSKFKKMLDQFFSTNKSAAYVAKKIVGQGELRCVYWFKA